MARYGSRTASAVLAATLLSASGAVLATGALATPGVVGAARAEVQPPTLAAAAPLAAALSAYDPRRPETGRDATAAWLDSAFAEQGPVVRVTQPCPVPVLPGAVCQLLGDASPSPSPSWSSMPTPRPTSSGGEQPPVQVVGYNWARDAGDLDADARHDVFANGGDTGDQLVALRGTDGATLYTRPLSEPESETQSGWSREVPAGDVDGDGTDDTLLVEQSWYWSRYPRRADARYCSGTCSYRSEGQHRWLLSLRRGSDGEVAWRRAWHGRSYTDEWQMSDPTGSSSEGRYSSSNAWLLVDLADDLDGDGTRDVVATTADVSGRWTEERSAAGLLSSSDASTRNTSRGHVLRGTDGAVQAQKVLSDAPALAVLEPAGDVSGDGREDLLWQVHRREDDTTSCTVVCQDPAEDRRSVTVNVLDGRNLSDLWSRSFTQPSTDTPAWYGEGQAIFASPLHADATGDGRDDVLLHDIVGADDVEQRYVLRLLDGVHGGTRWSRPDTYVLPVLGAIDGGPGVDLLSVDHPYDGTTTATVLERVDGATGARLFATEHGRGDEVWTSVHVVRDVDGDRVDDLVLRTWSFATASSERQGLAVESGATGQRLLSDSTDGFDTDARVAGDLDGDGASELLLTRYRWSDSDDPHSGHPQVETRVVRAVDGAVLWSVDAEVAPAGDQDGRIGDELLVSEMHQVARDRYELSVSSVEGTTGRVRWTVRPS